MQNLATKSTYTTTKHKETEIFQMVFRKMESDEQFLEKLQRTNECQACL